MCYKRNYALISMSHELGTVRIFIIIKIRRTYFVVTLTLDDFTYLNSPIQYFESRLSL